MATKVGIVSDSHGLLRDEVMGILMNCDCVIHAGDFCTNQILERFQNVPGKFYAVRGNNDQTVRAPLKMRLRFRIEELEFLLVHDQADAGREVEEADVIVFGHTHKFYEKEENGKLWLNPGSCGRPRFGGETSFVIMEVDKSTYKIRKIPLKSGSFGR